MKRKCLIFVFLLYLFFIITNTFSGNVSAETKVIQTPKTVEEYNVFLKNSIWEGIYISGRGIPEIYDPKTRSYKKLNTSRLFTTGEVFFGDHNDVSDNDYVGGEYRFLGLDFFGNPFPNRSFPADYSTSGNPIIRDYVLNPYENRNILDNSYVPLSDVFNNSQKLKMLFMFSGVIFSTNQSQTMIDNWNLSFDDVYARNQELYSYNNPNWRERGNENQLLQIPFDKLKKINNISIPSTTFSKGQMATWHYTNTAGGILYDIFPINKLYLLNVGNNLTAKKLDVIEVVDGNYEVYMEVKNTSKSEINTNVPLPTRLKIKIGNDISIIETESFGDEWEYKETKRRYLAKFKVKELISPNTKITVSAMFNPNKDNDFKEITYDDNQISKSVYTPSNNFCNVSGSGESERYAIKTCTSWDSEGNCIYKGYTYHSISLLHSAKVDFNKSKQYLLGGWTRYGNHTSDSHNNVPKATGTNILEDKWNVSLINIPNSQLKKYGVSRDMIESLSELNVSKDEVKRLLRAGRSLELYGTMKVDLKIMSFSGESDINKRKKKFMKELIESLKTEGVKVSEGVVEDFEGNSKVKARVDKERTNNGDYITSSESKVRKTTFGTYREVNRYEKEFSFIIPIESVNEGGKQETDQGNLGSDYEVGNALNSFYTNVKNKNGLYGLSLSAFLNGKNIDSELNKNKVCYSIPEKFKIDGNIYDDVGTEDIDVDKDFDDDWDF
ncbi:Athe_2463 domain-containing protein [Virgibacillus sp. DJP39]|uniref:Athe_2463 domain-containing protein n=1 Tax=Virgibacillus sp. DJP39 TaxID=3409790 RepID=UPI003BB6F33B